MSDPIVPPPPAQPPAAAPAPASHEAKALEPQEVSTLTGLLARLFGGKPPPAAPAPAPAPQAAASPPAPAPSPPPAPPAAVPAPAPATTPAPPVADQAQVDAMVALALKNLGLALQPRTPSPAKSQWPRTQTEVMQWAEGTAEQKASLRQAIDEGMKVRELPKR